MARHRVPYGEGSAHFNVGTWHDAPDMVMLDTGDIPEFKLTIEEAVDLARALELAALEASANRVAKDSE